jgi:hypothetical protein
MYVCDFSGKKVTLVDRFRAGVDRHTHMVSFADRENVSDETESKNLIRLAEERMWG